MKRYIIKESKLVKGKEAEVIITREQVIDMYNKVIEGFDISSFVYYLEAIK